MLGMVISQVFLFYRSVFYCGEVASLRTSVDKIVGEGRCLTISEATRRRLKEGDKIRYKVIKLSSNLRSTLTVRLYSAPTAEDLAEVGWCQMSRSTTIYLEKKLRK